MALESVPESWPSLEERRAIPSSNAGECVNCCHDGDSAHHWCCDGPHCTLWGKCEIGSGYYAVEGKQRG